MGVLGALAALIYVGLRRHIGLAIGFGDIIPGLGLGLLRHPYRVGTDIGDQARYPLALDLHALIKLLGDKHGKLGGKAQLPAGLLLQAAGGKGRRRMAGTLSHLDVRYLKRHAARGLHHLFGLRLGMELRALIPVAVKFGRQMLAAALDLQLGANEPILLRDKVHDLLFPVAQDPTGHGLDPTRA